MIEIDVEKLAGALNANLRGRSRVEVAATLGISRPVLWRLTAAKSSRPSAEVFMRVCAWLRRSPADFVVDPSAAKSRREMFSDDWFDWQDESESGGDL